LLLNPSFESNEAWELLGGYAPGYSWSRAHSGLRSMRLGLLAPYPAPVYSSVRQEVEIPSGVRSARVYFYYFLVSWPEDGDYLYLVLDRVSDGTRLRSERWIQRFQTWHLMSFDLLEYAGERVKLQIGVFNDGHGVTGVFLDDVELWVVE